MIATTTRQVQVSARFVAIAVCMAIAPLANAGERIEASASINHVPVLRGSVFSGGWTITDPVTGETKPVSNQLDANQGVRGGFGCPGGSISTVTHSASQFTGMNVPAVLQLGFEEGEIAAASYAIPAGQFPIQIDTMEVLVARPPGIAQSVTTEWSILVWSGNPNTGQLVAQFSSDDVIIPHIVLGPEGGVLVQALVDPTDPEQIIVDDIGNQSFTIGFRIDAHNVPGNPCLTAPPSDRNSFPTVDAGPGLPGNVSAPTQNWIDAVDGIFCQLGCGVGWFTFQAFPAMCTPSGDWNIRASYCSVSGAQIGACCLPDGKCLEGIGGGTCSALDGDHQGNGTTCAGSSCPVLLGACCDPVNGTCSDGVVEADCLSGGDTFQGEGSDCVSDPCPEPTGACCLGGANCLSATESLCVSGGFDYAGNGSQCPGACALGACCNPTDGTCSESTNFDCTSDGGNYLGAGTSCMPNQCPQPTGACCNVGPSQTCFPGQTAAACSGIGDWAGPGTTCPCAGCSTPGDLDGDGDIDLIDLAEFTACFGPIVPVGCECADMDDSGGVDLVDWAALEQAPVTGP